VIGDRHAVGVAAQITENVFWTPEGRLAVDHPVVTEEGAEERSESLRLREKLEVPVEAQLAVGEGPFESRDKLAAEDSTQYLHGEKETIGRGGSVANGRRGFGKVVACGSLRNRRSEASGLCFSFVKLIRQNPCVC
jgi:hypothetical protein